MENLSPVKEAVSSPLGKGPRRVLGGLALTLALLGGAEAHDSQPVGAQTGRSDSEHAPECEYGYYPNWTADRNGDGQPGPDSNEFVCLLDWENCESYFFLPSFIIGGLKAEGEITADQSWVLNSSDARVTACEDDPIPTPASYGTLLMDNPWIGEVLDNNPWIGDYIRDFVARRPGFANRPWAVMYQEAPDESTVTEPETPLVTTEPDTTDDTLETQPETSTGTTTEIAEDHSQEAPDESTVTEPETPLATTEPDTTDESTVTEPETPLATTEPDTTDESTVTEPETPLVTTEPDTTDESTVTEPETPLVTTEPDTTDESTVTEPETPLVTTEPDTTDESTVTEPETPLVTTEPDTTDESTVTEPETSTGTTTEIAEDHSQEAPDESTVTEPEIESQTNTEKVAIGVAILALATSATAWITAKGIRRSRVRRKK